MTEYWLGLLFFYHLLQKKPCLIFFWYSSKLCQQNCFKRVSIREDILDLYFKLKKKKRQTQNVKATLPEWKMVLKMGENFV